MKRTAFRAWLVLAALTAIAADVAFRWPDADLAPLATVLFGYFVFMHLCVALTIAIDYRTQTRLRRTGASSQLGRARHLPLTASIPF